MVVIDLRSGTLQIGQGIKPTYRCRKGDLSGIIHEKHHLRGR